MKLKTEYVSYHAQLTTLTQRSTNAPRPRVRSVSPFDSTQDWNAGRAATTAATRYQDDRDENGAGNERKRTRPRDLSPSSSITPIDRPYLPESQPIDPSENTLGSYPQGCVVWIRNLHEKNSTKETIKNVFARLLNELEEGSNAGVEFVDFTKGLDTVSLFLCPSV